MGLCFSPLMSLPPRGGRASREIEFHMVRDPVGCRTHCPTKTMFQTVFRPLISTYPEILLTRQTQTTTITTAKTLTLIPVITQNGRTEVPAWDLSFQIWVFGKRKFWRGGSNWSSPPGTLNIPKHWKGLAVGCITLPSKLSCALHASA